MAGRISELTNLTDPVDVDEVEIRDDSEAVDTDAQNKALTVKIIKGLSSWKQPVRAATTVNGALATAFENTDVIDGVTLATGDRILLKNQTAGAENGIYTVNATGAPTRATDFDTDTKAIASIMVPVEEGTANLDKVFQLTTNNPITIGTTALTFAEFGAGGGAGLTFAKVVKTVDETIQSDTILGDDAVIKFTPEINKSYSYMILVRVNSGAIPDFKFALSIPAGAVARTGGSSAIIFRMGQQTDTVDATVAQTAGGSDTVDVMYGIYGFLDMGGTAGDVIFQWAQNTSTATDTTVKKGTTILVWEQGA